MNRVLGLDLGSSSIGWAVVELESESPKIVKMGSRIVPLTTDDEAQFTKGQAITKNSERTKARTARKCYDRYQQRRENLRIALCEAGIIPVECKRPIDLWRLRNKAASEQISLNELGRVLMHLNQKRGYRSGKDDFNDTTKSNYVKGVNDNYLRLKKEGLTLGQFLYRELAKDGSFRVKDRVYPRLAYIEEYDTIISCQRQFYPEVLTNDFTDKLRNEIIFYQRRLKSCKHLVSVCEFEKRDYTKADGTTVTAGPHVAPKSSPISQVCKIWEFINTITISNNHDGSKYNIPIEQKHQIFEYLSLNEKLKLTDLLKILGLSKKDWWIDKTVFQRTLGNTTKIRISKALDGKYSELLDFNLVTIDYADKETGEIRQVISEDFKKEPLYTLWHTLYSISDMDELKNALSKKFGITDDAVLDNLVKLDFVKEAYSNKSATAMRKILPYLMQGYVYSDACAFAGYNHSGSITKEENAARELQSRLNTIKKGELRQPIVEKILNQTVNVVNALMEEYGQFDEIRVELARELRQSREERERATSDISKNEKRNKLLSEKIAEYGFTPTKNRILKMKLWDETGNICVYCGQPVNVTEFLSGIDVEKEHIIPRSLLFDNSSSNVTCSCRKCNHDKGNMTAYDFMKSKGDIVFEDYAKRVKDLFDNKSISKTKYTRLMTGAADIPQDFISRQLKETQYVTKKSMEMLREICHNVYATSGSVTDFLRHLWGWDNVLHDLHFDQYKQAGLTIQKEISQNGNVRNIEVIKDWSKRMDHRHHAIDALTIACTSQSIIQQLNTLSTLKDTEVNLFDEQSSEFKEKHSKLEKYALSQPHFSYDQVKAATENIIVSLKSGKKVATKGKRYVYRNGKRILMQETLVPRGALSEQHVYGRIQHDGKSEVVIKYPITIMDSKKAEKIVDKTIRDIVINYLETHGGKVTSPILDHQGREIRSVRTFTGLESVVPAKYNNEGEPIGFVKPGNNHHIAIYVDKEGGYHESVVTFWHAVERKKYGLPVIINTPQEVWNSLPDKLPEQFLAQLPSPDWSFVVSLQSNEMFVLGLSEEEINNAIIRNNTTILSQHLYRVQKIANKDYVFRHHLETSVDDKYEGVRNDKLSISLGKFIRVQSIKAYINLNPHKIRIDILGNIHID